MSEDPLNALASALRELIPSPRPLDRDAVLYYAGRVSRPGRWLWQLAAAASTLLAVGLGVVLATRAPQVRTVERIVYRPAPAPAPAPSPPQEPPSPSNPATLAAVAPPSEPASRYEQVMDQVYRWGLDALPPAPRTARPPVSTDKRYPSF